MNSDSCIYVIPETISINDPPMDGIVVQQNLAFFRDQFSDDFYVARYWERDGSAFIDNYASKDGGTVMLAPIPTVVVLANVVDSFWGRRAFKLTDVSSVVPILEGFEEMIGTLCEKTKTEKVKLCDKLVVSKFVEEVLIPAANRIENSVKVDPRLHEAFLGTRLAERKSTPLSFFAAPIDKTYLKVRKLLFSVLVEPYMNIWNKEITLALTSKKVEKDLNDTVSSQELTEVFKMTSSSSLKKRK